MIENVCDITVNVDEKLSIDKFNVDEENAHIVLKENPSDEEFLDDTDIPALMSTAYDRLRERGYTLWTWDTGSDSVGGWITSSRDDEAMRLVAMALEIELRPGSDPF